MKKTIFVLGVLFVSVQSLAAHYDTRVLGQVIDRVHAVEKQGHNPVVLFDLDETLINSRSRVLRILHDLAAIPTIRQGYPAESAKLTAVHKTDFKSYPLYLDEVLGELIGTYNPAFVSDIRDTYLKNYFSSKYASLDDPMPGAVEYAQQVARAGATIVYITGRPEPLMLSGTTENLIQKGFPFGSGKTVLMLKPRPEQDDREFKFGAMQKVSALGEVVAGFENEPANINVFEKAFPAGIYGFVDSTHSHREDVPSAHVAWIKDFRQSPILCSGVDSLQLRL